MRIHDLIPLLFVVFAQGAEAVGAERYVEKLPLPDGHTVVVQEGEFEARSIGSYSVLVYAPASAGDETTFFVAGVAERRDGVVEDVLLSDLDGDAMTEIIVVMRSAGSGSYLSVDAYRFADGRLDKVRSLAGLAAGTDPVAALRSARWLMCRRQQPRANGVV